MLTDDDRYAFAMLLQQYSLRDIVVGLASAVASEADDMIDMQMGDEARQLTVGAELLLQLADKLSP